MSQNLKEKSEHLEALEAFLKSPAHIGYVIAIKQEIQEVTDSILAITPDTLMDYAEEMQLRGELRLLRMEIQRFEDARVNLKARIDEIAETELENATIVK
jgi:hypothetical protein